MKPKLRLVLMLVVPVLLVLAAEVAFRRGAYEPLARPSSHAGMSVLLKRALEDPRLARIDTVALGDSRAVYGLAHDRLAQASRARGLVHANLTMPGTHWMSIGVLAEWLARHHPEIQGGVIGVANAGFEYPGNGAYELAIVTPFRDFGERAWIEAHVGVRKGDLATYGALSALMAYRDDVQDLLLHPRARAKELAWWRQQDLVQRMAEPVHESRDLCARPLDTPDDCRALLAAPSEPGSPLVAQCQSALATVSARAASKLPRPDYAAAMRGELPAHMAQLRDLIRGQLSALRWTRPPVVVLLPMHALFRDTLEPNGMREWALEVLRPLAEQGRIVVLDHSDDFIAEGRTDCRAFWDLYHLNDAGRALLAERLEPELEQALFADGSQGPRVSAPGAPRSGGAHSMSVR